MRDGVAEDLTIGACGNVEDRKALVACGIDELVADSNQMHLVLTWSGGRAAGPETISVCKVASVESPPSLPRMKTTIADSRGWRAACRTAA